MNQHLSDTKKAAKAAKAVTVHCGSPRAFYMLLLGLGPGAAEVSQTLMNFDSNTVVHETKDGPTCLA